MAFSSPEDSHYISRKTMMRINKVGKPKAGRTRYGLLEEAGENAAGPDQRNCVR